MSHETVPHSVIHVSDYVEKNTLFGLLTEINPKRTFFCRAILKLTRQLYKKKIDFWWGRGGGGVRCKVSWLIANKLMSIMLDIKL